MKPYVMRRYDDKAYDIVDRGTGDKVGYVLAAYVGWYGYLRAPGRLVAHARYRGEAADAVWQAHTAGES